MTFDRLLYIDRLKDAGIDEATARAHAEALREALQDSVATKGDLRDLGTKLDHKIETVSRDLEKKIERLDLKIDTVGRDLEKKIDGLDHKIETVSRDLVIKGAGGLVLIATLMIGLKLFG